MQNIKELSPHPTHTHIHTHIQTVYKYSNNTIGAGTYMFVVLIRRINTSGYDGYDNVARCQLSKYDIVIRKSIY